MAAMQLDEQGRIDIHGEMGPAFWGYRMKRQK